MATWINFKELRSKLRFADVLRHYQIEAKIKGDRATAFCPLPGHPSRTDGKPRTASLSINLTRNIFQCFGCKASGNALQFCCLMEGFDQTDSAEFRKAALKVSEVFGVSTARPKDERPAPENTGKDHKIEPVALPLSATQSPIINAPLDFEL